MYTFPFWVRNMLTSDMCIIEGGHLKGLRRVPEGLTELSFNFEGALDI